MLEVVPCGVSEGVEKEAPGGWVTKHLIVGYGRMGQRHAAILRAFGDHVDSIDLDWEPGKTDYEPYDSILVCTPPKTHKTVILDVLSFNPNKPPVFIEKPLVDELWEPWSPNSGYLANPASMVACNWRYCQCIDASQGFIEMGYPADQETAYLDMIHFLDLFWLNYGEPEFGGVGKVGPVLRKQTVVEDKIIVDIWRKIEMTVSTEGKMLSVVFDPGAEKPYMRHNGKSVHRKGVCSMFERQMRDWRECVKIRTSHLNSLQVAAKRTNWLISKMEKQ